MGSIVDEFKDLIVETEEESLEATSLRLITERKNETRLNNSTYNGISLDKINDLITDTETAMMPWKHLTFTLDVSKLADVSGGALKQFVIPSYIEEITSVGDTGSIFGFNETGQNYLKEIIINKNALVIDNSAFALYTRLEKVVFEKDSRLSLVGNRAFAGCDKLKTLDFRNCRDLGSIPSDICKCSGVTTIKLPSTLEEIDLALFDECDVHTIYFDTVRYTAQEFIDTYKNYDYRPFW